MWNCHRCTYNNSKSVLFCEICNEEKKTFESSFPLCPVMNKNSNELCSILAKVRFQNEFTEKNLKHLQKFNHGIEYDEVECKFGDKCYAYNRINNGGNALSDRCHLLIFKHIKSPELLASNTESLLLPPNLLSDDDNNDNWEKETCTKVIEYGPIHSVSTTVASTRMNPIEGTKKCTICKNQCIPSELYDKDTAISDKTTMDWECFNCNDYYCKKCGPEYHAICTGNYDNKNMTNHNCYCWLFDCKECVKKSGKDFKCFTCKDNDICASCNKLIN